MKPVGMYDFKRLRTEMGIDCNGNPRLVVHRPCKDELERLYPHAQAIFLAAQDTLDIKNAKREILPPTVESEAIE